MDIGVIIVIVIALITLVNNINKKKKAAEEKQAAQERARVSSETASAPPKKPATPQGFADLLRSMQFDVPEPAKKPEPVKAPPPQGTAGAPQRLTADVMKPRGMPEGVGTVNKPYKPEIGSTFTMPGKDRSATVVKRGLSVDELRTAVIMAEVLGKPVALRHRRDARQLG